MTTIAIEEKLLQQIHLKRDGTRTVGDFLNQVFHEWKDWKGVIFEWKDQVPFMQDLIKSQEKRIQELEEVIEVLKKDKQELEERMRRRRREEDNVLV